MQLKILKKNILLKPLFTMLLTAILANCVYIHDNEIHSNPTDVIYDNVIAGEAIRVVLTGPIKSSTSSSNYLLKWSNIFSDENDYLVADVVLYQKNSLVTESDIAIVRNNGDITINGFSAVTTLQDYEHELLGYSGNYSFILALNHPTISGKVIYSNIISFSF